VSLQKRAIQIVNYAGYNNHADPLFKNFKLSGMYQYQVCLFVNDFINKKQLPQSFDSMLSFNSDIQDDGMARQSSDKNLL